MNSRRLVTTLALVIMVSSAFSLRATQLAASAMVNDGNYGGGCTQYLNQENPPVTLSLIASASCGFFYSDVLDGTGISYAAAQFDQLSAYAKQSILLGPGANGNGTFETLGAAGSAYNDALKIVGTIQPAFIEVTGLIHGDGGASLGIYGVMTLQVGPSSCTVSVVSVPPTGTCSVITPVQSNTSIYLAQTLQAGLDVYVGGDDGNTFTLDADYSHTADISDIQFFDTNMQPLAGVQFVSDSGVSYLSEVPEPSTMAFISIAVVFVSLIGKYKQVSFGTRHEQSVCQGKR